MSDSLTNNYFELNLFTFLVLFVNKTSKHEVNFPFKTFSITFLTSVNYFKVAVKFAVRFLRLVFCICCVWN